MRRGRRLEVRPVGGTGPDDPARTDRSAGCRTRVRPAARYGAATRRSEPVAARAETTLRRPSVTDSPATVSSAGRNRPGAIASTAKSGGGTARLEQRKVEEGRGCQVAPPVAARILRQQDAADCQRQDDHGGLAERHGVGDCRHRPRRHQQQRPETGVKALDGSSALDGPVLPAPPPDSRPTALALSRPSGAPKTGHSSSHEAGG